MLLGLDDTDSPRGGCTTHFALEAAAALKREHGLVLRDLPRLVRLNPNIPWKTRGNAAVALDLGVPTGEGGKLVGVALEGTEIVVQRNAKDVPAEEKHLATLENLMRTLCELDAEGTDPAFVASARPLPTWLYDDAVKDVVAVGRVREFLEGEGNRVLWRGHGDGRGIVGACAALAYPRANSTFEIIAYRRRERWGTKREVNWDSVERMDRQFPETYHNLDRVNRHIAIAPSTPCPLLFGVRATRPDGLREAAATVVASEPWGGWFLFETNQGTDSHVVESTIAQARPMTTVNVLGSVASAPRRITGGHVIVGLEDGAGGLLECAAYEPTKEFRRVVGSLAVGDRVRAVGAIRDDRRTLNLEKLEVVSLVQRTRVSANPICPRCGARTKSAGRAAPFRCPRCGGKLPKGAGEPVPPAGLPVLGWHEVPISARRHLSKPVDPHGYM